MNATQPTFNAWAIVEVMGHKRFAGYVTEQTLAGAGFLRVDVPAVADDQPAFTKYLGPSSIYAITPCTEETARAFAKQQRSAAFDVYEAPRLPAPERTLDCGHTAFNCTCDTPNRYDDDFDDDDNDDDATPLE